MRSPAFASDSVFLPPIEVGVFHDLGKTKPPLLPTSQDGSSRVETEAALVVVGGAAWILPGYTGEAAVAEILLETSPAPEGKPDNTSCPDPKQKCSDYGTIQQMCLTDSAIGCGCEEKTCPREPLKCSECTGKDGETFERNRKCKTLKHSQVNVRPAITLGVTENSCPPDEQKSQCSDDNCKGNDQTICIAGSTGCGYTPEAECLDGAETLSCDDCGG